MVRKTLKYSLSFETSADEVQEIPMREVRRILRKQLQYLDLEDGIDCSISCSEIIRDKAGNAIGEKTFTVRS